MEAGLDPVTKMLITVTYRTGIFTCRIASAAGENS